MNTWNIFFPRNKYLRYLKIQLGKIKNVQELFKNISKSFSLVFSKLGFWIFFSFQILDHYDDIGHIKKL